ncbi:PX domain-containing protein [Plasmodiophora brassicae]
MDLLVATVTASNTIRDQKTPYTMYEIEVRSSFTVKWVIYKRYSDFFSLHTELLKIALVSKDAPLRLPHLPPKRLTRSLAVEFVEKRKMELQSYLTELLRSRSLVALPVVMQFLSVPDSVRPMLTRHIHRVDSDNDSSQSVTRAPSSATPYGSGSRRGGGVPSLSFEERKVREFVSQLNTLPNKVHCIRAFQQYFFSQRPRLTAELVGILFEGSDAAENGLFWVCGDVKYSIVASKAALDLICRLLDVEKNKDAQLFLDVLSTIDHQSFKRLNLHRHILGDRAGGAFQLASILIRTVPQFTVEKCLPDITARQEFIRWSQRKQMLCESSRFVAEQSALPDESPNLQQTSFQTIAASAFDCIHKIASSDQGWRVIETPVRGAATLQIVHKQTPEGLFLVRLACSIPRKAGDIQAVLCDESMRLSWDRKVQTSAVVQSLDEHTDVLHEVYKTPSMASKNQEFTMLRSWRAEPDGSYALVQRSISNGTAGRASLTTGFLLQPVVGNDDPDAPASTLLLWVAQLDRESVLLVTSDLLGECDDLQESFRSLVSLLDVDHTRRQGHESQTPS